MASFVASNPTINEEYPMYEDTKGLELRAEDVGTEIFPSADICHWSGTAPICKGKCEPSEIEYASSKCVDGVECVSGDKKYCCSQALYKHCYWDGTAPLCGGKCHGNYETV